MKNKIQIDKQKVALVGLLLAVAVGGYFLLNHAPEAEASTAKVETAPVVAEAAAQPAAPIAKESQSLGASSSGLGR